MEESHIQEVIRNIVLNKRNYLNIFDEINSIDARKLAESENFQTYFILINEKLKFILKLSFNKNSLLEHEHKLLQDLPEEIGPYSYVFDKDNNYSYEILSYEKGKDLQRYFEMHLVLFARKLAEVHKIKSKEIIINNKSTNKLNLFEYFISNNDKYFKKEPKLMEDKYVKELFPYFQKFLNACQPLFNDIDEFSLIHSNLEPRNVIFNEYDLRFLDWTKSHFCDNARDLATFFYEECWFNDKRVKLDLQRQNILFDNYLKAYWSDQTFKKRVKVWMIYDMFCSLIYCRYKLLQFENKEDIKVMYKKDLINESLELFNYLKHKIVK